MTSWGPVAWVGADLSRGIAQTASSERLIAPQADPSGGSGAWLRQSEQPVPIDWVKSADASDDQADAIQALLDAVGRLGGGIVSGRQGQVLSVSRGMVVPDDTTLDLEGATLRLIFAAGADIVGCQVRNRSSIVNGTVEVAAKGGPRGLNLVHHCCIIVGESGGPPKGYSGWRLAKLTLRNNRDDDVGGTGIVIYSGSNRGIVEDIDVPSSATLGSAIRVHWASFTAPGATAPTASAHPHDIVIRRIRIGTMTKRAVIGPGRVSADVAAIDIVSAYNVTVQDVEGAAWAGDAFCQVRAGAFGSAAADRESEGRFLQGIVLDKVRCARVGNDGILVNGRAHGGGSVRTRSYAMPVRIRDCVMTGVGAETTPGKAAFKTMFTSGVVFERCIGSRNDRGLFVDEASSDIRDEGGRYHDNQRDGVCIVNGRQPPQRIMLSGTRSFGNGRSGGCYSGFYLEACAHVTFVNCVSGRPGEDIQFYGFQVAANALDTVFKGQTQAFVAAGGVKMAIARTGGARAL